VISELASVGHSNWARNYHDAATFKVSISFIDIHLSFLPTSSPSTSQNIFDRASANYPDIPDILKTTLET